MGPERIELPPQPLSNYLCEGCILATRPWAPTVSSVDTEKLFREKVLSKIVPLMERNENRENNTGSFIKLFEIQQSHIIQECSRACEQQKKYNEPKAVRFSWRCCRL